MPHIRSIDMNSGRVHRLHSGDIEGGQRGSPVVVDARSSTNSVQGGVSDTQGMTQSLKLSQHSIVLEINLTLIEILNYIIRSLSR